MQEVTCLIGFDAAETRELSERLSGTSIQHEMVPRIRVQDGRLYVESPEGFGFVVVSRVVFHGIFENDLEFLAGLALWGGPCFPNPTAMMDCRLRLPCLVRALRHTRFSGPPRGFVSARTPYHATSESVAKWGNWHCGENKERFSGAWEAEEACLIEPFVEGEAVRVLMLGEQAWQIRLGGEDWRKSVHGAGAAFMELDSELVADTRAIRDGLGLDVIANDYIVSPEQRYLLEVNHIPSLTCFPELWRAYLEVVVRWAKEPH